MNKIVPLEYGKYFHIYNRGINKCDIFEYSSDYEHFLNLYSKYINLIADTYAWVLMKNHFHLLVRIKNEDEIFFLKSLNASMSKEPVSIELKKKPLPYRQFSHLFNAYAKYFNKRNGRTGSLFEKNFERIEVSSKEYFCYLIYYIHHNPVHHGFTDDMLKYKWSSFITINSKKLTCLKRKEVIEWFEDLENFNFFHNQQHDLDGLREYLID